MVIGSSIIFGSPKVPSLNISTWYRSKKASFASLPNFGPWVEPMTIPKEASKLKWSNWEITNGKNDSSPAKDEVKKEDVNLNDDALSDVFNN